MLSVDLLEFSLAEAQQAADAGDAALAFTLAGDVRDAAVQIGHASLQARSLLTMANCALRVTGRLRIAFDSAQHAAFLFEQSGDLAGECAAQGCMAVAATFLAQYEDAVESGWFGMRLAESLPPGPDQLMACHCLGVANYFGKNFDDAIATYERGLRIAASCSPPVNPFQLHLHQAAAECLRYTNARALGHPLPPLDRLEAQLAESTRLLQQHPGQNISLAPVIHWNNVVTHAWASMLLHTWRGDLAAAQAELTRTEPWRERLAQRWIGAAIDGAHAELALLQGDVAGAMHWAREMQRTADRFGHEAIALLSHQLLMHLHELQGATRATLDEARRMAIREQRARCESLKGRARLIEWRLDLREQKASVQRLADQSSALEQMALHDALTGLPNRRQLDQRLSDSLRAATARHVCVALIDVDHFKQINDDFSHGIGDAVLKELASIFDHMVRDSDLAARWAGDEFVLVLHDAEPALAAQVCQRIERAVREHDWGTIAPGLAVSVSVGLCQAQAGDTVASVLERSDLQMYEHKRQTRHAH
ncbi:MAG TPA: GGDEF domain-containing protein [Ideonella sp.]|uniref:tetratricopeptide repeat-containing diguanylate cyclase n=1 Tax=Ideonella sp. TaxID=1929293 RepID=UPI002E349179|nr:GGDEF domain-containing protein [Ideonella sp.]HEX5687331.1 GGDEF domain-containing protein [Ideonella sp.]